MKTMWLAGVALGASLALGGVASAQDINVGVAGPMTGEVQFPSTDCIAPRNNNSSPTPARIATIANCAMLRLGNISSINHCTCSRS